MAICKECYHYLVCKFWDNENKECSQFKDNTKCAEVVLCQNCTHHDTESCPENRVWCKYLRRYMKPDGYCSYGEVEK